jgi:hypothetical protein
LFWLEHADGMQGDAARLFRADDWSDRRSPKMSTVQVSLVTNGAPPVTCNPKTASINQGNQTIKWEQAQNQNFCFTSLTFLDNPTCFSTPVITDTEITVTDNNTAAGEYPYILVVTSGGIEYSTATGGIAGGGGDPAIKNK